MSLVERAVRRLEALGKSAGDGADEQGPGLSSDVPMGTIERAIRRAEALRSEQTETSAPASAAPASEALPSPGADWTHDNLAERQEPTLGPPSQAARTRSKSGQSSFGASQPARKVELDLTALASQGFIDLDDPGSTLANEFRRIKRPLIRACQGRLAAPVVNANRIMVTSSLAGEGKSFVALNLALSMAMERDFSVLLVDADTTRRSLSSQFGVLGNPGLLDLLESESILPESAILQTSIDRLHVLPAGAPQQRATELLASDAMEHVIEQLASRYQDRILIFDAPPLLGAPEPAVLASHMGQIVVVVEAGKTTRRVLNSALATIESCPLVTAVLNKASSGAAGYHGYHYHEATPHEG